MKFQPSVLVYTGKFTHLKLFSASVNFPVYTRLSCRNPSFTHFFQGKYLSYGCQLEDYVVKIGEDDCENIEPLFDNEFSCYPPETEPHDPFELDGAPRVVVSKLGRLTMCVFSLTISFSFSLALFFHASFSLSIL